ncbi:hypothetical protein RUND412_010918 [Rhizina undulata]
MATETQGIDPESITTLRIISSSKISKIVDRVLKILYAGGTATTNPENPGHPASVVALRAEAKVASKAITITETVKRRISENGGRWFHYSTLGGDDEVEGDTVEGSSGAKVKDEEGGQENDHGVVAVKDEDEENEDPDEDFQEWKKKRTKIIVTIFISLSRIDTFAELYGEQSSDD